MKTKKHIIKAIVTALIFITGLLVVIYHKTVYIVMQNLLSPKVKLDQEQQWTGGISYIKIPYSDVSESDYLNLYVPTEQQPPLMILVHGGGFIANDCESRQAVLMYQYFRDHGYACATVNYRLAQEAAFPAAIEDVKAAVRFLRAHAGEYGYHAEKIVIWGESAGGYLAAMAAFTGDDEFTGLPFIGEEKQEENVSTKVSAKVSVLVDYYGCIELGSKDADWKALSIPLPIIRAANCWIDSEMLQGYEDVESFWCRKNMDGMTEEEREVSDPYTYIEKNLTGDTNLLVWTAHGDCDITIPYLQSVRLSEALTDRLGPDQVRYVQRHNYMHADDRFYSEEELDQLMEFLDSVL